MMSTPTSLHFCYDVESDAAISFGNEVIAVIEVTTNACTGSSLLQTLR